MIRASTAALPVLVFALAGCGGVSPDRPAATPQSPAAATTGPSAAEDYDVAQRLVGGLNKAGIACLNWQRTDNPIGAVDLGSCYVGTEEVVAAIHASHEDAAAVPDARAAMLQGVSDVNVVVGGNWTLSCDSWVLCKEIEAKFGGRLVVIPA